MNCKSGVPDTSGPGVGWESDFRPSAMTGICRHLTHLGCADFDRGMGASVADDWEKAWDIWKMSAACLRN